MKSDITQTHFCDRCQRSRTIEEWKYRPAAFGGKGGFEHVWTIDTNPPAQCGWVASIPEATEEK